jgi:hypothetical protein
MNGGNEEISINPDEFMDFMKSSHKIFLPNGDSEKQKVIDRIFHDSCMLVQVSQGVYVIGKLNWTNAIGYSLIINGEEKQFFYSDKQAIFKPKLC